MQQKKRFPTDPTIAPVPEYITAPPVIPARPDYIPFPQPNYFPNYPGKRKQNTEHFHIDIALS